MLLITEKVRREQREGTAPPERLFDSRNGEERRIKENARVWETHGKTLLLRSEENLPAGNGPTIVQLQIPSSDVAVGESLPTRKAKRDWHLRRGRRRRRLFWR